MVWAKKKSTSPAPKVHQKVPQGTYFIDFYIGFFLNLNKSSLKKKSFKKLFDELFGLTWAQEKIPPPTGGKTHYRETWASTRPAPKQSCQK